MLTASVSRPPCRRRAARGRSSSLAGRRLGSSSSSSRTRRSTSSVTSGSSMPTGTPSPPSSSSFAASAPYRSCPNPTERRRQQAMQAVQRAPPSLTCRRRVRAPLAHLDSCARPPTLRRREQRSRGWPARWRRGDGLDGRVGRLPGRGGRGVLRRAGGVHGRPVGAGAVGPADAGDAGNIGQVLHNERRHRRRRGSPHEASPWPSTPAAAPITRPHESSSQTFSRHTLTTPAAKPRHVVCLDSSTQARQGGGPAPSGHQFGWRERRASGRRGMERGGGGGRARPRGGTRGGRCSARKAREGGAHARERPRASEGAPGP